MPMEMGDLLDAHGGTSGDEVELGQDRQGLSVRVSTAEQSHFWAAITRVNGE